MVSALDKVNLKCDCVDGKTVNRVREKILVSLILSALSGYKMIKERQQLFCNKK